MSREEFSGQNAAAYDPNEIMVSAQDEHGHTTNTRVHMPPHWSALLHQIADSVSWPEYRNIQDIIRDALYHRLYWIGQQKDREKYPGIRTLIAEAQLHRMLDTRTEQSASFARTSQRVDTILAELNASQSYAAMKEMIQEFSELGKAMDEPYRSRFEKQLGSWADRIAFNWDRS